jgi:capsular exopolysaccharide synthesis family protein
MKEEVVPYGYGYGYGPGRDQTKGRFLTRLYRYRVLLATKWWVILLSILLGVAGAAAYAWFGPPSFTSVGRMIVSIKLAIPEGSVYSEEMTSFLGTQTALMQSGVVIGRARARLATQHTNVLNEKVAMKVTVLPKTSIFVLQASGRNPEYTEAFLQACMEEYIEVKKLMRTQTSETTTTGLTEEILRIEKDLRKCDQELAMFQSTNSMDTFQDQGNSAANYLNALNQRLASFNSEYELLRSLTLDQNLERKQTSSDVAADTDSEKPHAAGPRENVDSDYLKAKQQILLMKAEQQDMAQYLRPKHPKMVAMAEDIARRERLLEIFRQQSLDQLEARKATLALQITNLEKEVKAWDAKALEVSRKSGEYQRLKANSQRFQALYDRLLSTMNTLDVNREISPESVTIMEKASPALPDRPEFSKQLLIGAIAGFVLSIGLLMLVDRLDDRMNSYSELKEIFDEEVLGQIPKEKIKSGSKEPGLIQEEDDRHAFVEAYRNLRSSLLYMGESRQRPRTIVVTSSVPNDGKSLTSANFATIMAMSGSKVLLVDADLRKGGLHHRFALPGGPGLSEVLSQGLPWRPTVLPTKISNLSLMPRGQATQRSSELFIGPATESFLRDVVAEYEYIVLDTAPVMAADDVTSLAPNIDGVIFVIRAEQTSARVARAAIDLLYQRKANVLGLVFNSVHPRSSDYYYYYKYYDYYHVPASGEGKEGEKSERRRKSRSA